MRTILTLIICIGWGAISHGQNSALCLYVGPFSPQEWAVKGETTEDGSFGFNDYSWPSNRGFGDGFEYALSYERYRGKTGLRLELGARVHNNHGEYNNWWDNLKYKSRLTVLSAELDIIYRMSKSGERFSPYVGFGPGFFIVDMNQKSKSQWSDSWDIEQSFRAPALGIRFLSGFDYTLYKNAFLGCELGYSFVERDFELENPNNDNIIKIHDLNVGGTSLRFGLGYRF